MASKRKIIVRTYSQDHFLTNLLDITTMCRRDNSTYNASAKHLAFAIYVLKILNLFCYNYFFHQILKVLSFVHKRLCTISNSAKYRFARVASKILKLVKFGHNLFRDSKNFKSLISNSTTNERNSNFARVLL